jgi:hypothetical protein
MSRVRLIIGTMLANIDLHHAGMECESLCPKLLWSPELKFAGGRNDLLPIIVIQHCWWYLSNV